MDSSSGGSYGIPQKRLHGHGHFVSDVVLSSDGHFALSGSWDKTLRLWDLSTGNTTRRFESHTKDVMSVAFSADNRQIVSGSRDKSIKLWNTLAQCKYTIQEEGHGDWVSCVRFSPNNQNPIIVSCGWDKYVKVWNPFSVSLLLDSVFALGQGIPQLDGFISGSTDNLTIIGGEGHAQNIVAVIFKTPGGSAGKKIPQSQVLVPRSGQGEVSIRRQDNV